MKIGSTVTWESQAGGSWKTKTGKVIAVLPKYESAKGLLDFLDVPASRIKFQLSSEIERVIVEVHRGGKSKLTDLYAPRPSQLKVLEESK